MIFLKRLFILIISLFLISCSESEDFDGPDYNTTYDLHITGGSIVDGTGARPSRVTS